jgi:hypothetical protein
MTFVSFEYQEEQDGESPKPNRQESSDESSEDGEINKVEEEYDEAKNKQAAEAVTLEDISKARITRDMLAKYCHAPWFEELVKGKSCRSLAIRVHADIFIIRGMGSLQLRTGQQWQSMLSPLRNNR